MGEVELQTSWDKISSQKQYYELFGQGKDKKSVVAHNKHSDNYNHYGRTAILLLAVCPVTLHQGKTPQV